MKQQSATDKIKQELVEKHQKRVGHISPVLRSTASAHYLAGVTDALEWVREFNEQASVEAGQKVDSTL